MRDVQIFQLALGLSEPWQVTESVFDAAQSRLDLHVDFVRGAMFPCPECGVAGCKPHDTEQKTWRHLNFFQHEAYIHARTPRIRCEQCGVRVVQVPWARPGSGFTLLFEALVMMLVKSMPVAAIAKLVREHDTRLWRIIHYHVDEARAHADFSEVRCVGMDEKASKRGHNYLTLFVDLERSQLLFATETREATTVAAFHDELERHGGVVEQIEEVCMDMWPPYLRGVRDTFPEASVTFDKFHVTKLLNDAIEKVRRQERRERPELAGSRYVWMKNPENLTSHQFALLELLRSKQFKSQDRSCLPYAAGISRVLGPERRASQSVSGPMVLLGYAQPPPAYDRFRAYASATPRRRPALGAEPRQQRRAAGHQQHDPGSQSESTRLPLHT
jgi:transposase